MPHPPSAPPSAAPSAPWLSVVIITYNEAHNILHCLASLPAGVEVVVMDSGSTDGTVDLVREHTPFVHEVDWPGDGVQRNRGLAHARGAWVLFLDADECLSPQLRDALVQFCQNPTPHQGASLPFHSYFLGKHMRFGDWAGEKHVRLMRRGAGRYSTEGEDGAQGAHCELRVEGSLFTFHDPVIHHPFPDMETVLRKMDAYSTGSAWIKHQRGQRGGLVKAILHGSWAFFRGYVMRLGFLDGFRGFVLAKCNADGTFHRYLKMRLLSLHEDAKVP